MRPVLGGARALAAVLPAARGITLAAGFALALGGCATPARSSAEDDALLAQAFVRARQLAGDGLDEEAYAFASAARALDPQAAGLDELDLVLRAGDARAESLGGQGPARPARARPAWQAALLYLPDRLLDLADVVSFEVHAGYGLRADAHLTRFAPFALGARLSWGLGWHERRSLGWSRQADSSAALLVLGRQRHTGVFDGAGAAPWGTWDPGGQPAHDARDPYAAGVSATIFFAGVEADLHPLELADFLLGWATIDWLGDDTATTRPLALDARDDELISEMWRVAAGREDFMVFGGRVQTARPRAR